MKWLTNVARLARNNPLPFILLSIVVTVELFAAVVGLSSFAATELILTRAMLYFLLALSIVFPSRMHHQLFRVLVAISVPGAIALLVAAMYYRPVFVDHFAFEDGPIENLSAVVLFIGAALWVGYAIVQAHQRAWLQTTIALGVGLVLFVIGMEEISWMQRVIGVESSEFFLANNAQGETNLHNINTGLSETLLSVGAAIVLVILPFYSRKVTKLLARTKLRTLALFVPSAWILLPFAAILGLMGIGTASRPAVLFVTLFTLSIMLYRIVECIKQRNIIVASAYVAIVAIMLTAAYTFLTFPYADYNIRFWLYTEYLEFFIEFGLLVYTIDFMFKNTQLLRVAKTNSMEG